MNIIKAGYEIMPEPMGPLGLCKKIELVARTCYKSEDLITEDSCIRMIGSLISREHYAMLEHASLVFEVDSSSFNDTLGLVTHLEKSLIKNHELETFKSYLRFTDDNQRFIISGNIRAWIEFLQMCVKCINKIPLFFKAYLDLNTKNDKTDASILFKDFIDIPAGMFVFPESNNYISIQIKDCSKLSLRERLIHQDLSVKFIVDRGVTHELVRHRDCSFAQESTRYCNYSKGKFGEEIAVIEPCFFNPDSVATITKYSMWQVASEDAEETYFDLVKAGATPQEARDVLPTSVKADIILTTNIREWIHILELRALGTTGKPHPQMSEVMVPLAKEFVNGLLSDFTCIDSVNKMLSL